MKDFLGNILELGDEVIFMRPGYRDFVFGKIIKFTPQKVKVEYQMHYSYQDGRPYYDTYMEYPTCFIKHERKEP
ncbi:hypothetical protein [Caulobacter phage Cr30]|uniref:hypothetical protein n=1 Tax=Caulobacter phage Cr30 TaxID=1357714 RepID=UPI0004A9B561|nr:hypothetical protein OZ74_gp224 [Caulobacter phage Cr30]AGS81119.1 hypothetical protein [Caulobacter phage Cr30]